MKIYSNPKHLRRPSALTPVLASNIEQLASMLQPQQETSQVSSQGDPLAQSIALAQQFVSALNDPYRTMLLYPLVLDSQCNFPADSLFQQTTYPPQLHSLLSLHLHKTSAYGSLQRHGRKVIDLFYLFLSAQTPQVLSAWLTSNHNQSLGQWFFSQCVTGFFQLLYTDKHTYTTFICNFMQFGVSYMFMAAVSALRKEGPPEVQQETMRRVKVSYIERYGLQDS